MSNGTPFFTGFVANSGFGNGLIDFSTTVLPHLHLAHPPPLLAGEDDEDDDEEDTDDDLVATPGEGRIRLIECRV